MGYKREVQAISDAVDSLVVKENKADFFSTIMYSSTEPDNYTETSGAFLKKYLKVNKYCGDNNGDCFAQKYYEFKDNDKVEYSPDFKGACASLKNGMSLCITPQIGNTGITGIIDINGKKGPNIKNQDLMTFALPAKNRIGMSKETEEVYTTTSDLTPDKGNNNNNEGEGGKDTSACELEPEGLDCCKTKADAINSFNDPCCTYSTIKNSISACKEKGAIHVLHQENYPSVQWEPFDLFLDVVANGNLDPNKISIAVDYGYIVNTGYSLEFNKNYLEYLEISWNLENENGKYSWSKNRNEEYELRIPRITLIGGPNNYAQGPYPMGCSIDYDGKTIYNYNVKKVQVDTLKSTYPSNILSSPCTNFSAEF